MHTCMEIEYIKCHGSGNLFIMVDSTVCDLAGVDLGSLSRQVCDCDGGIGADGLLLLVYGEGHYGMRMFNPDGSEAEMCGNGIRCIARLAEAHAGVREFDLTSGGGLYRLRRCADIAPGVATYGVDIPVRLWSADFATHSRGERFVGQRIPQLDPGLRFTAISVGNPHIVARVDSIDYNLLEKLGHRVVGLREIFPNGVNVSLVEVRGRNEIFVATYERGAGITPSCGTAMTSSATAMALAGDCGFDENIRVLNRGGAVECLCMREGDTLLTRLVGNATFESRGRIEICGGSMTGYSVDALYDEETAAYGAFLRSIGR